ncbi:hypothetical protein ILUMI_09612 [Ignelater luminosus]|uniref:Serine palmitoyltransferase 1 n=1 Tax=Ignelater luminosus TaxID=2038154 RepID=A0A8K0GC93_IGNLU|nr:hypothetical protein ILUMI_09612 [Ignelater luminosus]
MFDEVEEITVVTIVFFIVLFLLTILFRLFSNFENENSKLNDIIFRQRLRDFCPAALLNEPKNDLLENNSKIETFAVNEGDEYGIDLAKVNYLNMLNSLKIKEIAAECIYKYGVGTCGPRGFFGTTEIHLELESSLAKFLGMEEAIIYAYGFAAPSNAVPAYCKKTDVIFCDEKINFALEQGVLASKSIMIYFKHNSINDLRQKLIEASEMNSPLCHLRKFLIIEGIYCKTGTICPLPDLLGLVKTYKLRIFIDESISFGILGEKGRGVTEHFGIDVNEIDLIIGSLEGAVGSIGSFCASTKSIIEQQRLSSTGYVFSASLPTFQVRAAITALKMIDSSPEDLFRLQLLSRKVHKFLQTSLCYSVQSDPISPYKVFNFKIKENRWQCEREICDYCRSNGIYLIANEYGIIMNLNVSLYYQKSKLLNIFAVLDCAANNLVH